MRHLTLITLLLSLIACACLPTAQAATALDKLNAIPNAGFIITDEQGKVVMSQRENDSFIPASTAKLVTAWLALSHWGEDYRFSTSFYLDRETATLWIKGSGDPFLVSEELTLMAEQVLALEPGRIDRIGLDVSLFEANLVVPGATVTNNPYDAIPTAISANFNTLNLRRTDEGIESAESQTPLTPFARSFSDDVSGDSLRINTGRQSRQSERYFAELLSELLRQKGLEIGEQIIWGSIPSARSATHYMSSRTLGEVIQGMLKYSTNFIANQLMLTLAAEVTGMPANFNLVREYMHKQLSQQFQWQQFALLEGAGLSHQNRLSALQMIELLKAFKPWEHLLPEIETGVFAKTGTLNGVSTLAGYLRKPNKPVRYFTLLINAPVPAQLTREIALELAAQ